MKKSEFVPAAPREVFGLVAVGCYGCFPSSSRQINSRLLFSTRAKAEAALPGWVKKISEENVPFHGPFVPHRSEVTTFILAE